MQLTPRFRRGALVAPWLALALHGCSDGGDACGIDGASGEVVVTAGDLELRFGQLIAGANNDCPAADAPAGVVSLTIAGTHSSGSGPFTLCVSRPDLLDGRRQLGTEVELVDVSASDSDCMYRLATTPMVSGTVTASGVCEDGTASAGFALELAGEVTLQRLCTASVDTVRATISGRVPVASSR